LLRAFVQLKAAVCDNAVRLHWIPVDFVTRAIVSIARYPILDRRNVFHLIGNGPNLRDVITELRLCGYSIVNIDITQWRQYVNKISPDDKLFSLKTVLLGYQFSANKITSNTDYTESVLTTLGVTWPQVSSDNIRLSILYLVKSGYLNFYISSL